MITAGEDRRSQVEAPNERVDPQEQFPDELGSSRDAHNGAARLYDTEHRGKARDDDERTCDVVQSSFPQEQQGEISGLSRSVSNPGSSLGTAVGGTILVSVVAAGNV